MRAALRSITSFDVEDLSSWKPESAEFGVMVRLLAGPADAPGEESFDLVVCSGGWLAAKAALGPFDARHHTVVKSFDWPELEAYFEAQVRACEGRDWPEVAAKLSRIGYWEFEDYRPALIN